MLYKMHLKITAVSAVIAGMLIIAPATAADLTIAVQKVPDSLDPVTENSNVTVRTSYSLYETLVKTDYRDGGKLKPGLATEWKVIDAKTIEFKLRDGVVFHNGDTFDANDVVATFEPVRRGLVDTVPVASKQFLGGVDRVEVVDPITVRIHMKEEDAIALNRFAGFPSHIISETAFKEAKDYEDFAAKAIGTGPYKLVRHEIGKEVILEAFDKYWGAPKAAADKVTFTVVPELSTRFAGLSAGQFDIITEVGVDDIAQIDSNPETTVVGGQIENIRGLFYDSTNDTLADPRIRQALNLAIDRELIVDQFYGGKTSVPPGWQMDIFGDMFLKDRGTPEYNVVKAKSLLEEAGYKGEEIVYRVRNYYVKQVETAQILQSMWKSAGLNVAVEIKENWSQVDEDDNRRQIVDASFTAYYPDPMGQFWRRFGPDSSYTYKKKYWVIDDDMQKLGDVLKTSVDTDERRKVFAEMLDHFEKNPHGAVLHTLAQFMGVRSDRLELNPLPSEYLDLTTDGVTFE